MADSTQRDFGAPQAPAQHQKGSSEKPAREHQWRRFLVPGTYDPITRGHLDIIMRASTMCDEVVVAVAESPEKHGGPSFSLEQRVALARDAVKDLPNVTVAPYRGLTVAFAREHHITAIVKGLRAVTDFEYELQQANLNYQLAPDINAVFVMADPSMSYISSSAVRELASFGADLSALVTPTVERALRELYGPKLWPEPES